jgi:hypothetical protein
VEGKRCPCKMPQGISDMVFMVFGMAIILLQA